MIRRIYSYLDYRLFLKDRFTDLKSSRRGVSHRSLALRAGFSSPNFLKLVMDGKRNLTEASIPKVGIAFELDEKEFNFFAKLVAFNQAKSIEKKDSTYHELKKLRADLPLRRVEHCQFEYFERWYHVAIRELVGLTSFQEDPKWIRQNLQGKVSLPQIRQSLRLLERLGFVRRDVKGRLVPSVGSLSTGDEVASVGIYRFHEAMLKKAQASLHETKAQYRDISSVTVSVSREKLQSLKQSIQAFRKEMLALAEQSDQAEAVYQMNIQLFPLSEILWDD